MLQIVGGHIGWMSRLLEHSGCIAPLTQAHRHSAKALVAIVDAAKSETAKIQFMTKPLRKL
jgi:hypothetical protein